MDSSKQETEFSTHWKTGNASKGLKSFNHCPFMQGLHPRPAAGDSPGGKVTPTPSPESVTLATTYKLTSFPAQDVLD